jgi:hypothetical protein
MFRTIECGTHAYRKKAQWTSAIGTNEKGTSEQGKKCREKACITQEYREHACRGEWYTYSIAKFKTTIYIQPAPCAQSLASNHPRILQDRKSKRPGTGNTRSASINKIKFIAILSCSKTRCPLHNLHRDGSFKETELSRLS